jgi:prevent-host-death family protein
MCYMERIGLRELRQHASRYIARVARGETIEVTQRGRLVARIVPARPDSWDEMIARGEIIPAENPGGLRDIVPIDCGVNLSEVLMQMREDERY